MRHDTRFLHVRQRLHIPFSVSLYVKRFDNEEYSNEMQIMNMNTSVIVAVF
jgi:hypothetical protein